MTSAPMGGYEPPQGHGEPGAYPTAEPNTVSTTDVAKDQAAQVGQSAKESGKQVASTAADEASNVTAEARRQARDLGREVSSQAQQQAALQKDKAASGLHSLAEELRSMAQQGGQTGPVTDLAHQAADKATDLASWLERRDPGSLLDEVRGYARRKPGTFLLGAAAAGIVAGRLTRGAVQANKDDGQRTTVGPTPHGSTGSPGAFDRAADIGGGASSDTQEATPIADLTAAEPADNGYEPAGRSL